MPLTWAQFNAAALALLTDRTPSDDSFVEAVSVYVKARVFGELIGDDKMMLVHDNKFKSLRRRLIGFQTTLDDPTLRSRVRSLLSDTTAGNPLLVQAVAYYVKAEIAREVNRDLTTAESYQKSYLQLRPRLVGFNHTLGAGLRAEVNKLLPVDKDRGNISTDFIDTLVANAVADIQGFGPWLDAHIAQAKAELMALRDRALKEIRQAVIDLQHFIEAYRVGHTKTYDESDVENIGYASQGDLPEQAQVRTAWIVYDAYLNPQVHRDEVAPVDWRDRQEVMIGVKTDSAQLAIDPIGMTFLCTPRLDHVVGVQLVLEYNGLKLDFADGDATPFDEGVAKAASLFAQSELAAEFGDSEASIRRLKVDYTAARQRLYVETLDRKRISNADNLRERPAYPTATSDPVP